LLLNSLHDFIFVFATGFLRQRPREIDTITSDMLSAYKTNSTISLVTTWICPGALFVLSENVVAGKGEER
jgi:hypothetical protein